MRSRSIEHVGEAADMRIAPTANPGREGARNLFSNEDLIRPRVLLSPQRGSAVGGQWQYAVPRRRAHDLRRHAAWHSAEDLKSAPKRR